LLKDYLRRELIHVAKELDERPPPFTGSPQSHLVHLCNTFTAEIAKYIDAQNAGYGQLIQATTDVYEKLRNAILSHRLTFDVDEVVKVDEEETTTVTQDETEDINNEDVQFDQFVITEPNPGTTCISKS
jgi:hypothetical protein